MSFPPIVNLLVPGVGLGGGKRVWPSQAILLPSCTVYQVICDCARRALAFRLAAVSAYQSGSHVDGSARVRDRRHRSHHESDTHERYDERNSLGAVCTRENTGPVSTRHDCATETATIPTT